MSIYYDYLDEYERSLMIESMTIENEFNKLQTLYEMTCLQLSQLEKEVEHKVFSESGSYDDYSYLLTEADNEIVKQKQGVIAKIINFIKSLFAKITGKTNDIRSAQISPDDMISVPSDVEEKSSAILKSKGLITQGMNQLQNNDFAGAMSTFSKVAAGVALVGITGNVAYKQIQKRKGDEIASGLEDIKNTISGAIEKVSGKINSILNPNDLDKVNSSLNPIQKISRAIDSVITAITGGIFKKGKSNSESNAKEQESRNLMQRANLLEKPGKNGDKYRIDRTTGEITHIDKDGKEIPVDKTNIPPNILKASQQLKGRAAAQAQEAKKAMQQQQFHNDQRAASKTFTPDKTGSKVFVDNTTGRAVVNGKSIDLSDARSKREQKKMLKQAGVTSNRGSVLKAVNDAKEGIKKASGNTFSPEETGGAKVYVDPDGKKIEIDGRVIKLPRKLEKMDLPKVLKQNGVRKNLPIIITAIRDANQGMITKESACEIINKYLEKTVMESTIYEDSIILLEYPVDPEFISDDLISTLESDGFTIIQTEEFYEFY